MINNRNQSIELMLGFEGLLAYSLAQNWVKGQLFIDF